METKLKTYKMLESTHGSRDGLKVEMFKKGETYELEDDLAVQFSHLGVVQEVSGKAAGKNPAENRSTKVSGPTETKVTGPDSTKEGEAGVDLDTQHIEELVAVARDKYGLDVDSTMSVEAVKAAIEAAEAGEEVDTDAIPSDSKPATTEGKKADKAKGKK